MNEVNRIYLERRQLYFHEIGCDHTCLDTSTHQIIDASQLIATIEKSQGLKIARPEEIAYR